MTVASATNRVSYSGNGSSTVFAVPFYFLADSHLLVVLKSAAGVDTTQVFGTNYSVSGAGVESGGTVTMNVAPPTGTTLTISRNVPITQETDLQPNDRLPAESLEDALDKLTMIDQQINENAIRAIKVPVTDSTTLNTTLDTAAVRANKYLAFNNLGEPIATTAPAGIATVNETQIATAGQTVFSLANSYVPGISNLDVFVDGVNQYPAAYTETNSNTVTFSAGLHVGAEVRFTTARTLSTTQSDAATTTYVPAGTGAAQTNVQAKLRETVSVKDFGAVGDGVTDDTAAIQAAMVYAYTNKAKVVSPLGDYLLSGEITIPVNANGFSFVGDSLRGTKFIQSSNNTPVFTFNGGNNNSFEFGNFTIEYANVQPSTSTNARPLNFNVVFSAQFAAFGIYNATFLPLRFVNSCHGIYAGSVSDGDTYTTTTWGLKFGLLLFEGLSGRHISMRGANPNNRIEGPIYSVGSTSGSEPLFYFQNQDSLYIGNLEINNNFNGRTVLQLDQTRGVVDCFRQEIATYNAAGTLIQHSNSWVSFGSVRMLTTTYNMGAGVKFHVFNNSSTSGEMLVTNFAESGSTLTTGVPLMLSSGSNTNRLTLVNSPELEQIKMTDISTTAAASGLYIDAWNRVIAAANNGDASVVVTESSEMIQPFNTTLTANRTITLPNEFGVSSVSNLFNGKTFRIVRNAAIPGAFTLTVLANGTLYTIPSNTKMMVELTYRRLGWVLTNYVVLV